MWYINFLILLLFLPFQAWGAPDLITNAILAKEDFVGRDAVMSEIAEAYNNHNDLVVLSGVAGIGKTQISRRYIDKNRGLYDLIWVFDCNNDIKAQYIGLGEHLNKTYCLKGNCLINTNNSQVTNSLRSFLENTKLRWLIVFDNYQIQSGYFDNVFPRTDGGKSKRIMVISREKAAFGYAIPVSFFSESESIKLLKQYLPSLGDEKLQKVVGAVGNYPLALFGVAKYLSKNYLLQKGEVSKVLKILQYSDGDRKHLQGIITQIIEHYPSKETIVKLLTCLLMFDHHNINYEFIKSMYEDDEQSDLLRAFVFLYDMGIIEQSKQSSGLETRYEMHDFIRKIVKSSISKQVLNKKAELLIKKIRANLAIEAVDMQRQYEQFPNLIENLSKLNLFIDDLKLDSFEAIQLKICIFNFYSQYLYYSEGEVLYKKIDQIVLQNKWLIGKLSKEELWTRYLDHRAYIKGMNNDRRGALDDYREALRYSANVTKKDEFEFLVNTEIAQTHLHLGDISAAKRSIKAAQLIYETSPVSADFNEVGLFHFNLAKIYREEGEYKAALKEVDLAIDKDVKAFGYNIFTLLSVVLKAEILLKMKDYKNAESILYSLNKNHLVAIESNYVLYLRYLFMKVLLEIEKRDFKTALSDIENSFTVIDKENDLSDFGWKTDAQYDAQAFAIKGDYYLAIKEYETANENYLKALSIYQSFMRDLQNDTLSLLLYKLALNSCLLGDEYNFNVYKNTHQSIMGLKHPRTESLYKMASVVMD